MNRAAALLLIPFASIVLAATTFAQSTPAPNAPNVSPSSGAATEYLSSGKPIIIQATPIGSCPVILRAQPGVGPGMVIVVTGHDSASQKLNLQFSNLGGKGVITHAQITVHGLTAHGRIEPASSDSSDASVIAKKVDLDLTVAPGASASRDMLFQGFTSVRWIELDSLTYANGSNWHATPQRACHITPDRMMLVASH